MTEDQLYDELSQMLTFNDNGEVNHELLDKATDAVISYICRRCAQHILKKYNNLIDTADQLARLRLGTKELRDTVLISCNPPDDCGDPEVLKRYMKACYEKAKEL